MRSRCDGPVPGACTGEMHRKRPYFVPADEAITIDDNLELIDKVEVRAEHRVGLLLNDERLRFANFSRRGIDIFSVERDA